MRYFFSFPRVISFSFLLICAATTLLFAEITGGNSSFLPLLESKIPPAQNDASTTGFTSNASGEILLSGNVRDQVTEKPILRAKLIFIDIATGDTLNSGIFSDQDGYFEASLGISVSIDDRLDLATEYWVGNIYPNPVVSSEEVTLEFVTPSNLVETPVVEMYDVIGRRVHPSSRLAIGLYFYRLRFNNGNISETRKFILSRSGPISVNLLQQQSRPASQQGQFKSKLSAAEPSQLTQGEEGVRIVVQKNAYKLYEETFSASSYNQQLLLDMIPAELPSAAFSMGDLRDAGKPVTFDASASTGPESQQLTYSWDFGDGRKGGQQKIARIYPDGGAFMVKLTVATEEGATETASQEIVITHPHVSGNSVTFSGIIRNSDGEPVENAELSVRGAQGAWFTDHRGVVVIDKVPADGGVTIVVQSAGYAVQRIPLDLSGDQMDDYFFETVLLRRSEPILLSSVEFGVSASGNSGSSVVLPPEALVYASGNVVTGDVSLSITPVDISNEDLRDGFPGNFEGISADGEESLIVSYGAAEYVFEQNGEVLQLAPGMVATIDIPVFVGRHLDGTFISEGDEIPMWSLHPETGKWINEGIGVIVASADSPSGFVQRGKVTHFSWWNCDAAPNTPLARTGCHLGDSPEARRICQVLAQGRNRPLPGFNKAEATGCELEATNRPFGVPRNTVVPLDGADLFVPPGYPLLFRAIAENGTLFGEAEVCLPAGVTEPVNIELFPVIIRDAIPISYGESVTGRLEFGRNNRYSFTASSQDFLRIEARPNAGSTARGTVALLRGNGEIADSAEFGPELGTILFRVEEAGEYQLDLSIKDFSDTGAYQISLNEVESTNILISYGQSVTGFIFPESVDRYRFTGSPNDDIWIRARTSTEHNLQGIVTLLDQQREIRQESSFSQEQGQINYKLESGNEYTITVRGSNSSSFGEYSLELIYVNSDGGSIEYGGTVAGMIGLGNTIDYTFVGTEGEWFWSEYKREDISGSANVGLISPTGAPLGLLTSNVFGNLVTKLPQDGTYTIRVTSSASELFLFSLRADTVVTTRPELQYDQWESDITANGLPQLFRFPATVGQQIRIDFEPDPNLDRRDMMFRLITVSPSGEESQRITSFNNPMINSIVVTDTGQGELVVSPQLAFASIMNEGSFRIRVREEIIPAAAGLRLVYGEETISTVRPDQLHGWTFEGTKGDPVRLQVHRQPGGPDLYPMTGTIYTPSGETEIVPQISTNGNFGSEGVLFYPLPETGEYRLDLSASGTNILDFSGDDFQPYTVLLDQILFPPVEILESGERISRSLIESYEVKRYCIGADIAPGESTTVTVSAGVSNTAGDGNWLVRVFGPNDQLTASRGFSKRNVNRTNAEFDFEITESGPFIFYVGRVNRATDLLGAHFLTAVFDVNDFNPSVCEM